MLSQPISAKVIFALALAILMAWAGHTSALFLGASQSAGSSSDGAHAHVHDEDVLACAACAGHYHHHSALTADHVHETPHLTTRLSVSTPPGRTQPIDAVGYSIPSRPIFLIERPPRATYVL